MKFGSKRTGDMTGDMSLKGKGKLGFPVLFESRGYSVERHFFLD